MKRITILILAIICSVLFVAAQNSQKEKDKAPEPEVGTLDAAWKPVVMDHYFGIRGGYGLGKARFEPRRIEENYEGLKNFGISYTFDAPEQKYVGCIEFGLNYLEKGYRYETDVESKKFNTRTYSMIEFPILWQPYLPLSSKNFSRIFLNAGPYLGYALKSSYRNYDSNGNVTLAEGEYKYIPARDNLIEYGLVLGGGFKVGIKRFALGLDFRYNIMLSDIMKNRNKYADNPFRSPVDQMSISFSVGYKFSRKKPIEVVE